MAKILTTAQLGHYALLLAFAIALVQSITPFVFFRRYDAAIHALAGRAAVAQCVAIVAAFGALAYAFAASDFSLAVIAENSHTAKPALYKFAGIWSNHEGSMLLWVLILALFGAYAARRGDNIPGQLLAVALAIQAMISAGFLAFILLTSNPFAVLAQAPAEGAGLNPILQDPALALHPPFLYLGYVGFSMAFSFAVAGLIDGGPGAAWARWVRPFALAAWCFLTIGIALGSFWAYYTLGWGGWWFWDPVENASLMPWLTGTAFLHSAIVMERRNALAAWTILLGIATFSLSLIGAFLVRSGMLSSVHAFAQDPSRGLFILVLVAIATGAALAVWTWRAPRLEKTAPFALVSRESSLALNNVFLSAAAFTVLLGTFYPLVVEMMGADRISVGTPYFARTFVPIGAILVALMAFGPALRWKRDDVRDALARLSVAGVIAAGALVSVLFIWREIFPALFLALSAWLVGGSLVVLGRRVRLLDASFMTSISLARTTPPAFYGLIIAHAGMGLMISGITGAAYWSSEKTELLRVGQTLQLDSLALRLDLVEDIRGPNYEAQRAQFTLTRDGSLVARLSSERRYFPVRDQTTTAAGIHTRLLENFYVALGDSEESGAWTVRFYRHPLVSFVWIGAFIMALGGFVSLCDKRLRIGAPHRARRPIMIPEERFS
ncbi:heme lyase CcmF/NrfE family subunit [Methylocystis sp. JAN1]|uniref:heme lyase CcmF/NrfE family subunit n=1 Tax=Methylocystis sp. JAN1 TaxID=3397211 RepID=UPI003FA2AC82